MPYCYTPLWQMLAEHDMSKTQFREAVGLSTATLAKLSANKPVSPDVLAKICDFFCCHLESVVTYASDMELFMISLEPDIVSWKYVLHINDWPEYYFELTDQQANFIRDHKTEVKMMIARCERATVAKYPVNGGIMDATKFQLSGNKLRMEGSFAVVELLLPWIIENARISA